MDEILQKFLDKAPVAVMIRATLARTMADSTLDDLFERHAESQYTRDLTFGALIRLMTQVVFCTYPSVNAAYRENDEIPVSITSVYNKLNGLETGISQALVAETAGAMAGPRGPARRPRRAGRRACGCAPSTATSWPAPTTAWTACGAAAPPPCPACRWSSATAAPGCSPTWCPARTPTPTSAPCTGRSCRWSSPATSGWPTATSARDDYLSGIAARGAFFLIRHHAGTKLHPLGPESGRGATPGGPSASSGSASGALECRCIIIRLEKPLRDGTTEIRLADQRAARAVERAAGGRPLPDPLADRIRVPGIDRELAVRDRHAGLSPRRRCSGSPWRWWRTTCWW